MKFTAEITKEMILDFISSQFDHPNVEITSNWVSVRGKSIFVDCEVEICHSNNK